MTDTICMESDTGSQYKLITDYRLSCEKFFVLIPVFVSYLIFREPPPAARALIRIISGTSQIFQKVSHVS